MPPNAAVIEGIGAGADSVHYRSSFEDGAAPNLVKGSLSMEDFRPVKALGRGDMGNVYLVAERTSNAPYAMKVIRKDVLRARKTEHRAQSERDILASVDHPFLPVLYTHFENEKHMFLVMNYCHAGDLNVLRHNQPDKRFSENACRFYVAEVLLALEYLHKRNIVYRDLKPENILIRADGHVMLTDFDLSRDLTGTTWTKPAAQPRANSSPARGKKSKGSQRLGLFACGSPGALSKQPSKKSPNSRVTPEEANSSKRRGSRPGEGANGPATSFVGTEEYVAPEIIWSKGHGFEVDWWTLGILLYELFYGKTPFKGSNRKETFYSILCKPLSFPGVPNRLTSLIFKLLAKEPENRLGTKGGAEEIKNHPFFEGLDWNWLEYMTRTPVVPDPFSWEQIEKDLAAEAKSGKKDAQSKWSFGETVGSPVEERHADNETVSLSGLLTSDDSSYQDRVAKGLISVQSDSTPASPPQDYSADEDCSSVDTFSLDSKSDVDKQETSMRREEEVRLAPYHLLMDEKLFGDVF